MLQKKGISIILLFVIFCFFIAWAETETRTVTTRDPKTGKAITKQVPVVPKGAASHENTSVPARGDDENGFKSHHVATQNPQAGEAITIVVPRIIDPDIYFRTVIKPHPEAGKTEIILIPMVPVKTAARHGQHLVLGPVLYCSYCGTTPSPEGIECPVTNNAHNFKKGEADEFVVCSHCGTIPSPKGTKCPVTDNAHNFKNEKADKLLVCSHCGAAPSPKGTKCPVTNANHNFKKEDADKLLVCSYCGAAPSREGTKCPVTNANHNFREY